MQPTNPPSAIIQGGWGVNGLGIGIGDRVVGVGVGVQRWESGGKSMGMGAWGLGSRGIYKFLIIFT